MSTGWELGIDFGTSYTVAAAARDGSVAVVDIESNGSARIPSAVFLTVDGELLVGTAAQHQAVFAPERYEPTPKRSLGQGELFLGDRLVPVTDLVAAVLRRVYGEACRQQGERPPANLCLTHPAEWGETRLAHLREAVERASLPAPAFLPEPVAAAARIALAATEPGQYIAVYDFGGGTFDAAVLQRTATGFELAGPPAGRDPLGGEDIDETVIEYLGGILADDDPAAWQALRSPSDVSGRRDAAAFRAEVQRAKETLSEITACQLWVPRFEREIQLTRKELEQLVAPSIDATVDTLSSAITDAGLSPPQLAGTYLVGGSSRVPLVAATIWRTLGIRPSVQDNPKSVVAVGAAAWLVSGGAVPRTVPQAAPPPVVAAEPVGQAALGNREPATTTSWSGLGLSIEPELWAAGCDCTALVVGDVPGGTPLTIRARDEPAHDIGTVELAERARTVRAARTPGYQEVSFGPALVLGQSGLERRFVMTAGGAEIAMFEQYLVTDGRGLVIAAPEAARAVAGSIAPSVGGGPTLFCPKLGLAPPAGWSVTEQLVLRRRGSGLQVAVTSLTFPGGVDPERWRADQLGYVLTFPGARLVGDVAAAAIESVAGRIHTVQWTQGETPMLTKLGLVVLEGHGISVLISLPHAQQSLFPSLANHGRLMRSAPH